MFNALMEIVTFKMKPAIAIQITMEKSVLYFVQMENLQMAFVRVLKAMKVLPVKSKVEIIFLVGGRAPNG